MKCIAASLFIVVFTLLCGCESGVSKEEISTHQAEIDLWSQKRIQSLLESDSWLSLAGLYWLQTGENSIGSDSLADIVFPEFAPKSLGKLLYQGDSVTFLAADSSTVLIDSSYSAEALVYSPDNTAMMQWERLTWFIIKRGNRIGVRLKDSGNPAFDEFQHIERFPTDINYRVIAQFEPNLNNDTINIPNVLGEVNKSKFPGTLTFKVQNKDYTLYPIIEEGREEEFFIIFGDATNGEETYGGGRFVYADIPEDGNRVILDFNKAYNPPCVFNGYATCPLPPAQNKLPFAIKAGEKTYENH